MKETGESTFDSDITGNKLYQIRARKALPILVRQAIAEQPIFYSDLAFELQIPNPRNLNYVLGAIGNSLKKLSGSWKIEIPLINVLVINKSNYLPGEGINWFIKDREQFEKSSTKFDIIFLDPPYYKELARNSLIKIIFVRVKLTILNLL